MKITDLKVFQTHGGHGNWTFVKLYTDSGLTGVGESSIERHAPEVRQALESFKDFLVGRDPFQIEEIWNSLLIPSTSVASAFAIGYDPLLTILACNTSAS